MTRPIVTGHRVPFRRAPLVAALLLAAAGSVAASAPARAESATPPVQQAHADSPSALVQAHSDRILKTLVQRRQEFARDPAALHAYVDGALRTLFDREYSARLVLAQHGRGASPEAVNAFAEALTDNLLRRYGDALLEVDPKIDVRVKGETPLREGAIVRVATEIDRQGGAPVPVDYLFRDTEQGWKVFDVIVEGVSYVQTYRTQFGEQLRGKSLAEVTAELEQGRLALHE